jgi:hypothetical protein
MVSDVKTSIGRVSPEYIKVQASEVLWNGWWSQFVRAAHLLLIDSFIGHENRLIDNVVAFEYRE